MAPTPKRYLEALCYRPRHGVASRLEKCDVPASWLTPTKDMTRDRYEKPFLRDVCHILESRAVAWPRRK